jgi:hypothetical protein
MRLADAQVPHLSEWIPNLPQYENPAVFADHYHAIGQFVDPDDVVRLMLHLIHARSADDQAALSCA